MLKDDFTRAFREPGPLVLALACGMALGIFGGAVTSGGDEPAPPQAPTVAATQGRQAPSQPGGETPPLPPPASDPSPSRAGGGGFDPVFFRTSLDRAARAAERRFAGRAEAAILIGGWGAPVFAGDPGRRMRMWSISKPVTAIAALRATGGRKASPELARSIEKALVESHNCGQRRVVLGLQTLTKRGPEGAQAAFQSVLADAGVTATPANTGAALDECADYFNRPENGGVETSGSAAQFGTSEWTIVDAARFAHALGGKRLGAEGEYVRKLLSRPKRVSDEQRRTGFTVPVDWGAGRALAAWQPAYKAGWGGEKQRQFMAAQIATFIVANQNVAVAVAFHPDRQPDSDDPGKSTAPDAVESILRAVGQALNRAGGR